MIQYAATATLEDGSIEDVTRTASWQSSNPDVATISSGVAGGHAVGRNPGQTTITASEEGVVSNPATLTVIDDIVSLTISPAVATVGINEGVQYAVMAKTQTGELRVLAPEAVHWVSASPAVGPIQRRMGRRKEHRHDHGHGILRRGPK